MSKRAFMEAIIISALLVSTLAGHTVQVAKANPYQEAGTVPPDSTTFPSTITVFSPLNGSAYSENTIPLSINVTLPESSSASFTILYYVIYQVDWSRDQVFLYSNANLENSIQSQMPGTEHQYFQKSLNLTGIPNGNHSITVTAVAGGTYRASNLSIYRFYLNSSSKVFFTADSVSPTITNLLGNNTYHEGGIFLLDFTVDEPTSWIGYSLDNKANVTIGTNTTLSGLAVGSHNLTVYANDTAGNMGKSDIVFFEGDILPITTPSQTQRPTLEPTQKATPVIDPSFATNPFLLFLASITFVTIAAAIAIALVLHRRAKKQNR